MVEKLGVNLTVAKMFYAKNVFVCHLVINISK